VKNEREGGLQISHQLVIGGDQSAAFTFGKGDVEAPILP
jgi:hypothetical protein